MAASKVDPIQKVLQAAAQRKAVETVSAFKTEDNNSPMDPTPPKNVQALNTNKAKNGPKNGPKRGSTGMQTRKPPSSSTPPFLASAAKRALTTMK